MTLSSPFHPGELAVQVRANEADIAQRNATVVSKHIIKGALPFIGQQFMAVVSSSDEDNRIWTSVLFGEPGFISAPDDQHVLINPQQMIGQADDPLWRNIRHNSQVGLLIIELSTRRRLRVNGSISLLASGRYQVTVAQAYPNCPKYIQRRQPALAEGVLSYVTPAPRAGEVLTSEQVDLIVRSDSLFVGSGVSDLHYDASYRGGDPGFVAVVSKQQLLIPDYKGNSMFNTLGNFELNPHAGLVFIDFENNKLLQLTGTAKVLWGHKDDEDRTGGTKRYWHFNITGWRETDLPPGLHWTFFDYSPHNPKPKSSEDLALVVADIEQKSPKVKLFRLTSQTGVILPAFEPGAHLPVEVELPRGKKALRHYSIISSSHDNRFYEIAVQQEKHGSGGSNYLHKKVRTGQVLTVKAPVNEFSLSSKGKHHILIAGGIGITPVLSMLRQLAQGKESYELHYSVKTRDDLVFKEEVQKLAGDRAHFYCTREENAIRLDLNTLLAADNNSSHVYICGPAGMIQAVKDTAVSNGWQASQIHYESFGGAIQETDREVEVKLQKSGQVIVIDPKETLLDGLLAAKVPVPFECKRGECGMCVTEYVAGTPEHRDVYLTKEEKAHSMCLCVSRAKSKSITLNL
ncbi:pyridoxamine 5'-phosphate oxidase family protein [Thalassomonas viridans]|uniref:Pyridoxamine 5'-phosphate oxidase family protein n=1 Tax=Thalassomonas viridans TaxID=137584 RepID=A0AAE9Z5T3_9GAMM|nr:pyridoxamine 5'-phosphate oxidase family protein [Thalassomonas viridans]WDE05672.1 pyridoxamine 5'-phosphate oxidase family protein [Thalassomonas viridans]